MKTLNLKNPKLSDHFDGKKFFNPTRTIQKSFKDLLKWRRSRKPKPWPQKFHHKPIQLPQTVTQGLAMTYINHDTFLIQTPTHNILTDPILSKRASPLSFAGPHRVRPPAMHYKDLPTIHAVLVSHNHYDHMDLETLKTLDHLFHPIFIVPLRNAHFLHSKKIKHVIELDWWGNFALDTLQVTLTPAQHWSARGLRDRNHSLWGSFWIHNSSHSLYHAGDTGYGTHFKEIHKRLGSPSVSLLPIGAYEPRWFMQDQHMNPEDAVRAHLDLKSKLSLGMHYGTFQLTDEGYDDPIDDLQKALIQLDVDPDFFKVPDFGETIYIP